MKRAIAEAHLPGHRPAKREEADPSFPAGWRNDNRQPSRRERPQQQRLVLSEREIGRGADEEECDVNYTWGIGNHGQKQGGAIFPEIMRCSGAMRKGIDGSKRYGRALVPRGGTSGKSGRFGRAIILPALTSQRGDILPSRAIRSEGLGTRVRRPSANPRSRLCGAVLPRRSG